jgi:hypothetical protein
MTASYPESMAIARALTKRWPMPPLDELGLSALAAAIHGTGLTIERIEQAVTTMTSTRKSPTRPEPGEIVAVAHQQASRERAVYVPALPPPETARIPASIHLAQARALLAAKPISNPLKPLLPKGPLT